MKTLLYFLACLNIVFGMPPNPGNSGILGYKFNLDESGTFSYSFFTNSGIANQVKGELKNVGTPEEGISISGTYSYIAPNGNTYRVNYTADREGFRPNVKILSPSVQRIGESCKATLCSTGLG